MAAIVAWLILAMNVLITSGQNTSLDCPPSCSCHNQTARCRGYTSLPPSLPVHILHLDLQSNQITDLDLNPLTNYSLEYLDLGFNSIANISWPSTEIMVGLKGINLEGNLIQEIWVNEWVTLPHLESMNLAGNVITKIHVDNTSGSHNGLSTLDLSANQILSVPNQLLLHLSSLRHLNMSFNTLNSVNFLEFAPENHPLLSLDLQHNAIVGTMKRSSFAPLCALALLDLSHNHIDKLAAGWLGPDPKVEELHLNNNRLTWIENMAFENASRLNVLTLGSLRNLSFVAELTFSGLVNLTDLALNNNENLKFIHPLSFDALPKLIRADLSQNSLTFLHPRTFHSNSELRDVKLEGNPWSCDCEGRAMLNMSWHRLVSQIICSSPLYLRGVALSEVPKDNFTCEAPQLSNSSGLVQQRIGASLTLDCIATGNPRPMVTWITNRGLELHHEPAFVDHTLGDPSHDSHDWHVVSHHYTRHEAIPPHERVMILHNGSLYIDYMTRRDGGHFTCFVANEFGNDTFTVEVVLDYTFIKYLKIYSIVCGLICAAVFFSMTGVVSLLRFVCFFFSDGESKKRRSIREILETIKDFRADKFDKLSAYKSAKMDQLTAYKTAKFGQLSAYKSAQIYKIRTYKQVTVTNIYSHMHQLQEYYHSQMTRVKDNCTQQVDKLRDHYSQHLSKFKENRSQQIEKIRDQYNSQAEKVREYSSQQMHRLREQYKLQHLHLMKLLELLDMGNCMSVMEAECMRTESEIFQQDINVPALDTKKPSSDDSGDSEYLTAGSHSEESSVISMPYVLSVESETPDDSVRVEISSESVDDCRAKPTKVKKKRRKRHVQYQRVRKAEVHSTMHSHDQSGNESSEPTNESGPRAKPANQSDAMAPPTDTVQATPTTDVTPMPRTVLTLDKSVQTTKLETIV